MLAQTIPNPPGSPPAARARTNQFSQKNPARAPEMRYTGLYNRHSRPRPCRNTALYDPRKPSAHPIYLPPTMPSAPPPSLPSLATSVHGPLFHQSPFSVRLRSSQIVSDRLRSSQIVWDRLRSSQIVRPHRPPFPQNRRNVRPIPPLKPAKERVTSRHFASLRAIARQNTPANAREKSFAASFGYS